MVHALLSQQVGIHRLAAENCMTSPTFPNKTRRVENAIRYDWCVVSTPTQTLMPAVRQFWTLHGEGWSFYFRKLLEFLFISYDLHQINIQLNALAPCCSWTVRCSFLFVDQNSSYYHRIYVGHRQSVIDRELTDFCFYCEGDFVLRYCAM